MNKGEIRNRINPLTEGQIGWLAGLLDGEGYVDCDRYNCLRISNTSEPLIDAIRAAVGVGAKYLNPVSKKNPKWKDSWDWCLFGDDAKTLLRLLLPWLIVKRERAEILAFKITRGHQKFNQSEKDLIHALRGRGQSYSEIARELNRTKGGIAQFCIRHGLGRRAA